MNKSFIKFISATILTIGIITPATSFASETDTYNQNVDFPIIRTVNRKQSNAQEIIDFAKNQIGKPYVWGASGPNSFDCSGFIYYVFSQNGYSVSRTTVEGYWNSSSIQKVSTPQKGDLIFFKGTYGGANHPSHIGIMVDDNNFIHASSGSEKVRIDNKNDSYYKNHLLGYGRIITQVNDGWKQVNGKWYYYENGVMAKGWKQVNSKWYYLNEDGAMATGWKQVNSKWYYLNEDGAMHTGWKQVNSKWYYLNEDGAMHTGWKQVNSKWYYLNEDGAMHTGWKQVDGKWYYLDESGAMKTNTVIDGWQIDANGVATKIS